VVEIIKSFEQVAGRLSPAVVVVPGIVLTAVGLVIWLGGIGFRRVSLALAGMILGSVFVLATGIHSPAVVALSILAAAFVAIIIPRFFSAVLLAKLVAGILFIVLAWSLLAAGKPRTVSGQQALSTRESLDLVRAYGTDLTDNIKRAGKELPLAKWLIVAAVGLVVFASGLLFRHAAGALACSTLGTVLIWSGLAILLMYKGSMPVRRIEHDALAYGLAAVGMVAFGALEQYVLCRRGDRKRKAKQLKDEQADRESKHNWRGE
jgi:hypothetical protein